LLSDVPRLKKMETAFENMPTAQKKKKKKKKKKKTKQIQTQQKPWTFFSGFSSTDSSVECRP
jgi:hypothetical protein